MRGLWSSSLKQFRHLPRNGQGRTLIRIADTGHRTTHLLNARRESLTTLTPPHARLLEMVNIWLPILASVLAAILVEADATRFVIKNNLRQTIWASSFGENNQTPNGGGWKMSPGQQVTLNVDGAWNGRFWARTGCKFDRNGNGQCETGDCARRLKCNGATGVPPATLAEFKLNGFKGLDFYDVSNVDGFNVPVTITPLDKRGSGYSCTSPKCTADINRQCPRALQLQSGGRTVGCKSACTAFNTPQYCCAPPYQFEHTCRARDWPVNYPAFFKGLCPDAYSYAYDDKKSTWTCKGTGYRVVFG